MIDLHPDYQDLLSAFTRLGVKYALLGGYAVSLYASPRTTTDLDLLISAETENLVKVARALEAYGASSPVCEAVREMSEDDVIFLGTPPHRIDLICRAVGVSTADVMAEVVPFRLPSGITISVISLAHLLANKKALGRPQDLADVHALEEASGGGRLPSDDNNG